MWKSQHLGGGPIGSSGVGSELFVEHETMNRGAITKSDTSFDIIQLCSSMHYDMTMKRIIEMSGMREVLSGCNRNYNHFLKCGEKIKQVQNLIGHLGKFFYTFWMEIIMQLIMDIKARMLGYFTFDMNYY